VPDGNYMDPSFWNLPAGVSLVNADNGDFSWTQRRALFFDGLSDFDFYSDFFDIEYGATYRVKTRIWNNGGAWTGAFWPLIHMPNVAWWSLKHGVGVDDATASANASNAIVANGDTGDQTFYFVASSPSMRQIQFRFKSTARGSPIQLQVQIAKIDGAVLDKSLGQLIGPTSLPPIAAMGLRYKYTGAVTYSAAAGSPATATISVAAGSMLLGDQTVAIMPCR
jgi:hypothetical protein